MKSKLLIISLFFCAKIIFPQTSLSGVVEYQSSISESRKKEYLSNKRSTLDKASIKKYDQLYLSSLKINSTLYFSGEESIFTIDKTLSKKNMNIDHQLIESWSGGNDVFYSNSKFKINNVQNCETLGDCFIISSEFEKWQLTQETKQISGYTCYKAIRTIVGRKAKKDIFAWYTPSIPVNFGPNGASGLPGLILELELGTISFYVKKIVLNPKEKVEIRKPDKGKKITQDEFNVLVGKVASKIYGKTIP